MTTRGTKRTPTLRLHKRSQTMCASFSGRRFNFGRQDDPETRVRFATFLAKWEAAGRQLTDELDPTAPKLPPLLVRDLVAAFLVFAKTHYRKDGKVTQEYGKYCRQVAPLLEGYGYLPAAEFRPSFLRAIQDELETSGLTREYVNHWVWRIKRIFKWGVGEEFVPYEVFGALSTVPSLQKGRSKAREPKRIPAVSWEHVEPVLAELPSTVLRAMVLVQYHSGARPMEVRQLRPTDVDRSGSVWHYTVRSPKSAHHDRGRVVLLGPKAQEVLRPLLDRVPKPDPTKPLFSPRLALAERYSRATLGRPSLVAARQVADMYSKDSYVRAVKRACQRAGVLLTKLFPRVMQSRVGRLGYVW